MIVFSSPTCPSLYLLPISLKISPIMQNVETLLYNRKLTCEKLIEARMNLPTNFICVFDKSVIKLNFWALLYINMIDWTPAVMTPPSLLSSTSYNDVKQLQADSFKCFL